MKTKFYFFILLSLLICSIFTVTQADGNLTVTPDGAEYDEINNCWVLNGGNYTISGASADNEYIKVNADTTITLDNCTIEKNSNLNNYSPAISIESGNVNITIIGENSVKGDNGFAGIYVSEDATLRLQGTGTLNAEGGQGKNLDTLPANMHTSGQTTGSCGGAAGIGGNALWTYSDNSWVVNSTINFGKIIIESGTINANGGKCINVNLGAGAGIGTGGGTYLNTDGRIIEGNIDINGGTINAIGGQSAEANLTNGGAGIGTGGLGGENSTYIYNNVNIIINKGTVTALGSADGAGIGGGNNVDSGIINITGGTIETLGGIDARVASTDTFSGAGIGGGDNGGVRSITISGGKIKSQGNRGAAGIGAGNNREVGIVDYANHNIQYGIITIKGNAEVEAYGGSSSDGEFGGAGIGAGTSYDKDNGFGKISIIENAKVRSYGGAHSQAVGYGAWYEEDNAPNIIHFGEETIDVWLFTNDENVPAFWGQNEQNDDVTEDYSSDGTVAVWYSAGNPQVGVFSDAVTDSDDQEYKWKLEDNKIKIIKYDNTRELDSYTESEMMIENYKTGYALQNWATFTTRTKREIKYEFIGDDIPSNIQEPEIELISSGTSYNAKSIENIPENYRFEGWYTDANLTNKYVDGTTVNTNLVLYGKWIKIEENTTEPEEEDDDNQNTDMEKENGTEEKNENDTKEEVKSPKTGDNIVVYVLLGVVCIVVLGKILVKKINN